MHLCSSATTVIPTALSASRLVAHSVLGWGWGSVGVLKLLELAGVMDISVTMTLQWNLPSRRI